MDEITLNFPNPLNVSVKAGDTVYYTNDVNGKDVKFIGVITSTTISSVIAEISPSQPRPTTSSFILFSKTANVNTSGLKGYYAEMQFKNDTTDYAELFLAGSNISESSK